MEISKIAETFISHTLGDAEERGMCFTVCYPLSEHLKNNGIPNLIEFSRKNGSHYWIMLPELGKVIDPTVRQFGKSIRGICFDKSIERYTAEEQFNLIEHYHQWQTPFLNGGTTYLDYKIDISPFLKVVTKAATILFNDIRQNNLKKEFSDISKDFFDFVKRARQCNCGITQGDPSYFIPSNFSEYLKGLTC